MRVGVISDTQMAGIKYWLTEVYLLEPEPVEPVKAA
jgi:hypothetical protein